MALIKCPECNKNISDKAEACPHCGYNLKQKSSKINTGNALENLKGKWDNKYLLILIVLIVGVYFIFFNSSSQNAPGGTNEPNKELKPNANGNYEFNQNGKYFEFPTNYKVYISKDGSIYVGKNIDDNGALIPYIMIDKYKSYTDPVQLLSELTTEIGKEYSDARITIDLVSGQLNDKATYGIQYTYTSSGHVVVDNRYAFLVNNKSMYLVTTKEENVNTDEINNVAKLIIESLKEAN